MSHQSRILQAFIGASLIFCAPQALSSKAHHDNNHYGISNYSTLKYKAHEPFQLVNLSAPKGGHLKLAYLGPIFTTLNPFDPISAPAPHIRLTLDSLMMRSPDEPFALYNLLAQRIEMPEDRSWLIIHLDPEAYFHNGKPVQAEDVLFTYNMLSKYYPSRKALIKNIKEASVIDPLTIRFDFLPENGKYNRELPMLILIMPIFSRDSLKKEKFDAMRLNPLIGSGPYRIGDVEPGKMITYVRDPKYWAKNHIRTRGLYNFDRITMLHFGQESAAREAVKKGEIHHWQEEQIQNWSTFNAQQHFLRKEVFQHQRCVGMSGIALNQKCLYLQHPLLRHVLILALSDPQIYKACLSLDEKPTISFFQNTLFAAKDPLTEAEKQIIKTLPNPDLNLLPDYPQEHRQKEHLLSLLQSAGCTFQNGKVLYHAQPLKLRILIASSAEKRMAQCWIRALEKLGIGAEIILCDKTQYQKKMQERDYDLATYNWRHGLSPGIEQHLYWHSCNAFVPNSRNYACLQDANIDALCEKVVAAKSYEELTLIMRVLDRALRCKEVIIPLFHNNTIRQVFAPFVQHPAEPIEGPYYPFFIDSWWFAAPCKQ